MEIFFHSWNKYRFKETKGNNVSVVKRNAFTMHSSLKKKCINDSLIKILDKVTVCLLPIHIPTVEITGKQPDVYCFLFFFYM